MSLAHSRLLVLLLLTACNAAGWTRVDVTPDTSIPPRQVVEIWHGSAHEQWHGVALSADSVIGVPYFRRLDCDSCRMALPRAAVDSMRYGDPVTPGVAAALTPIVALLLFGALFAIGSSGT